MCGGIEFGLKLFPRIEKSKDDSWQINNNIFYCLTKLNRINTRMNDIQKEYIKSVYEDLSFVYICVKEMEVLGKD